MALDWKENQYCINLINPVRLATREVSIGSILLGGDQPVRIQSMTNTITQDTKSSVNQAIKIFDAGADFVRFTASSSKEAVNLKEIKKELVQRGYHKPLIADVHFNPAAAEIAAKYVEKVRINPGNFLDKKSFQHIEYTVDEYQAELVKLKSRFISFLKICKENNTSIRIGTNHGSLSDRIMSRYGDTPKGMVEATMEFLRICNEIEFNNVVISLKSSNTRVMVQAYRLLVNQMMKENMNFPIHLGVTEAGEGEDGRIKSAVGMGSLLLDGIGDTIRVSLTEAPEKEIPVAQKLLKVIDIKDKDKIEYAIENYAVNPFDYKKQEAKKLLNIGGNEVPRVLVDLRNQEYGGIEDLDIKQEDSITTISTTTPDFIIVNYPISAIQNNINFIVPIEKWKEEYKLKNNIFPLFSSIHDWQKSEKTNNEILFIHIESHEIQNLSTDKSIPGNAILIISPATNNKVGEVRASINKLNNLHISNPILFSFYYDETDYEEYQLKAAAESGIFFIDGIGDGILLGNTSFSIKKNKDLAFNILQAARTRTVKTEYISCPSCGRTLFDIEEVTAEITKRTRHLVGLKIGIMGCIVNGPGEMADADYGYVGTANGKITLYKNKDVVKKNIPSASAVDELIKLIKDHGDWKDYL